MVFNNPESLGVPREAKFVFGDGTVATTEIRLFKVEVFPRNPLANVDLPLNAQYGLHDPDIGFRSYRLQPGMMMLEFKTVPEFLILPGGAPELELELAPSIHAAWDSNMNGIAEPGEDLNNDKHFDERDAAADDLRFRGKFAANPLVGFKKQFDTFGNPIVRGLKRRYLLGFPSLLRIYGNTEDRRRTTLDLKLSELGDPDGLPDFVSAKQDGERLLVRAYGVIVDCLDFTAFNITAKPSSVTADPEIDFDKLKSEPQLAYGRYSRFKSSGTQEALSERRGSEGNIGVYVDHESNIGGLFSGPSLGQILRSFIPSGFSAGLVDQYFMARRTGPTSFTHIGRDGRVRSYEPEPGRVISGTKRYPFGVELDGILFDSNSRTFRLDKLPNDVSLLQIPVVRRVLGAFDGELTDRDLFPSVGPRSGGFVDLSARETPGFYFEAKLPVAEFPGMHGGYLIQGKPDDLVDPRSSTREDDIEDVSLTRNLKISSKPLAEGRFSSSKRRRDVMVYGSAVDQKEPIRTAVRADSEFVIGFDPIDYTPADPAQFKIKATLDIQEIIDDSRAPFALMATTQSDGDEETIVKVTDAAIDLAVDVTSSALLGVMTGGSYLQACGGVSGSQVFSSVLSAGIGLSAGFVDQEVYGADPRKPGPSAYVTPLATGGISKLPGVKIPNALDYATSRIKGPDTLGTGRKLQLHPKNVVKNIPVVSHCSLFSTPIGVLKSEIKSNYSVRSLGGGGSASASASKVLALCIDKYDRLSENDVYAIHVSLHRKAEVMPVETFAVKLSSLPWKKIWDGYPYPDEISDLELISDLADALDDDKKQPFAERILRKIQVNAIIREMDRSEIEPELKRSPGTPESYYQEYTLRARSAPGVGLVVSPGGVLDQNRNTLFGDFTLTPGSSRIPVSFGAAGTAGRSNENSNAWVQIEHDGLEMILRAIVIQDPADL